MSAMRSRRRRVWWVALAIACVAGAMLALAPYASSAAFVLDLAGSKHWVRRVLPAASTPVTTADLQVPGRHGPVHARLTEPVGARAALPSVIVFPGVHAGGVDEPRLSLFSRRLAGTGVRVLSVPIPDLRAFRITERSTDVIEDAIAWMSSQPSLAPTGRVGVAAISFAGGLALVAAGRPATANRLQFVVSVGGHGDLPRVMTYLCSGRLADGTTRAPHDYGVAIIMLAAVDRVVPAGQVEPLRQAVLTFLTASSDTSSDQARADQGFRDARDRAARLAEPARTYMNWVNERNTVELGRLLLPYVEDLGGAAALSPERSPATRVPVFLLHGETDNVIPSGETPRLAAYLDEHGDRRVRWLLTPLLSHAHLQERAPIADAWGLISFWAAVRGAAK
jgi:dienelactone hydrolase